MPEVRNRFPLSGATLLFLKTRTGFSSGKNLLVPKVHHQPLCMDQVDPAIQYIS